MSASVAMIGPAPTATLVEKHAAPAKDPTFEAQLEETSNVENHRETKRRERDDEEEDEDSKKKKVQKRTPDPLPDLALIERTSDALTLSFGAAAEEGTSTLEPGAGAGAGAGATPEPSLVSPEPRPVNEPEPEPEPANLPEILKPGAEQTGAAPKPEARESTPNPEPAAAPKASDQADQAPPTPVKSAKDQLVTKDANDSPRAKKRASDMPPIDVAAIATGDATSLSARMEDLVAQVQATAAHTTAAEPSAKTMTGDASPQNVSLTAATEEGAGAERVRSAEAVGHKHVLSSGEAHGHIVDDDLGRVEVRARAEATRIDVHVKAEEERTRQVIAAHAVDLRAHVQVDVPNASIHLERSISDFTAQNAFAEQTAGDRRNTDGGRSSSGSSRDENSTGEAGESVIGARIRLKGGRVRFVL